MGGHYHLFLKNTVKANLFWTYPKRVSVKLTGTYIGAQEDSILVPIDGYFTTDVTAKWEPFGKRFEFRAGILNAFDNDHQVTIGIPAPGRTVFIAGKTRF